MASAASSARFAMVAMTIAIAIAACGEKPPPPAAPPPAPTATQAAADPCRGDTERRAAVPELLRQGRLDRAVRAIGEADARCPSGAAATWTVLLDTLVELGRYREAIALADRFDPDGEKTADVRARIKALDVVFAGTDEAKAPMRKLFAEATKAVDSGDLATAEKKYVEAWAAWHPNGPALVGAGLAAKKRGDGIAAQPASARAGAVGSRAAHASTYLFSAVARAAASTA